jgi:hypothetical protein
MEPVTHPARSLRAHLLWRDTLHRIAQRRAQRAHEARAEWAATPGGDDPLKSVEATMFDPCTASWEPLAGDFDLDGIADPCDWDDDNDRDPDRLDPAPYDRFVNRFAPYAPAWGAYGAANATFQQSVVGTVIDVRG